MKPLLVADDFMPIAEFKAHASRALRRLREEQRPVVITHNGKPAAVLITPEEYDRMREHDRFVAGLRQGLAESDAGLVTDDSDLDEADL